jgi:hypothetical protein
VDLKKKKDEMVKGNENQLKEKRDEREREK